MGNAPVSSMKKNCTVCLFNRKDLKMNDMHRCHQKKVCLYIRYLESSIDNKIIGIHVYLFCIYVQYDKNVEQIINENKDCKIKKSGSYKLFIKDTNWSRRDSSLSKTWGKIII